MSDAFQLDFTGPQTRCDFPGCVRGSFHDGDHDFLSQQENNERAAAAVTSYGVGTRSYNGSPEKREMDRQREIATARYEASPRQQVLQPVACTCAQRPYPHEVSVHAKARKEKPGVYLDYYDLPCKFAPEGMRWPWSLRFAPEMEAPNA